MNSITAIAHAGCWCLHPPPSFLLRLSPLTPHHRASWRTREHTRRTHAWRRFPVLHVVLRLDIWQCCRLSMYDTLASLDLQRIRTGAARGWRHPALHLLTDKAPCLYTPVRSQLFSLLLRLLRLFILFQRSHREKNFRTYVPYN